MQSPKRRTYIIDLNGPAARGNLKLLALFYPFWGLMLPLYICILSHNGLTGSPFDWPGLRIILSLIYFILLCFSLFVLTNRLVLTGRTLRFGHRLFCDYKTTDLKTLSLDRSPLNQGQTLIRFGFSAESRKGEVIETQGMEGRMKARLMAAIDNLAPQCQTPKAVRTLLMQPDRVKNIVRNGDCIILPYHSRMLLAQVREMVALYQQYFWRVWAGLFGLYTVAVAPFVVSFCSENTTFDANRTGDSTSGAFLDWWKEIVGSLFPALGVAAASAGAIAGYAKLTPVSCSLGVLGLSLMLLLGFYMWRPNKLKLEAKGLSLGLEYFGLTLDEKFLDWHQLISVNLVDRGESNPADWKIELRTQDPSQSMQLVLGALGGNAQKLELVKAIEKFAPTIEIDPAVLAALAPPETNSFTELWLSSLASAPQREKLRPLGEGHTLKDGQYVIGARSGAGGQGVTYLAYSKLGTAQTTDGDEGAELVIKETILPIYVGSQQKRQAVEHFERDARLLSRLDHNNLVKLRDYFIEDHRAYLVLDRVHGQNLRQAVDEHGAMAPSVVLDLARQMCDMLIYLHEQDPEIIHRDFTPENLMLNFDGRLKLIDFGVAHQIKSRTTATVVGKHAYLPPEQFRGRPTPQSDLYALAATLYFLLTGADPEPLSCLSIDAQLAAGAGAFEQAQLIILGQAIAQASSLDLADRTQSARQLLQVLDAGASIKFNSKEIEIING